MNQRATNPTPVVDGDHILSTNDGGKAWRKITSDVNVKLFYGYESPTPPVVDFVTEQTGWIASTSLWQTTDGGRKCKRNDESRHLSAWHAVRSSALVSHDRHEVSLYAKPCVSSDARPLPSRHA